MSIAQHIRKLGFRRWHERQLIEAHASLVTAFLSIIMVAVCLDQFHWRDPGIRPWTLLLLIAAGTGLCWKTVTYYFKVLFRAEDLARQAACGACGVYGVIAVDGDTSNDTGNLRVHCRKCGHQWVMQAGNTASARQ